MFTVKEVANSLQTSTQAIYKQKQDLINKGYMVKNSSNQWEITDTGFNYLQDKRIDFVQQHNTTKNIQVANQVANSVESEKEKEDTKAKEKIDFSSTSEVANLLINQLQTQLQTVTNQLKEITNERDYFKAKFEEKDNICNQYINSHMLPPTENENEKENLKQEKERKGFFWKIFNK